jgi:hypothetical protein
VSDGALARHSGRHCCGLTNSVPRGTKADTRERHQNVQIAVLLQARSPVRVRGEQQRIARLRIRPCICVLQKPESQQRFTVNSKRRIKQRFNTLTDNLEIADLKHSLYQLALSRLQRRVGDGEQNDTLL